MRITIASAILLVAGCGGGQGPGSSECGDGTCDADESCESCPGDCGACEGDPVDGACGAADGVETGGPPTALLCGTGTASEVTGSGPWTWRCEGLNGGGTASCEAPLASPPDVEVPGPSAALFESQPYYDCVENRYVATAEDGGSDDNDGLAPTVGGGHGPWLTLQHANDALPDPAPGFCVNVGDGTYTVTSGVDLDRGGDEASTTGFTVWRSTSLLGARIEASGEAWSLLRANAPYLIIEGFEIVGNGSDAGSGIDSCSECCGYNGRHHVVVLNNFVHGMGGSGVATCWAEYFWVIHNRLDENAANSWYSGVSVYEPAEIPGYTPTEHDERWTPYHNVIAWNRCSGNFTDPDGGPHTDGNGIIYDDSQHEQNDPHVVYAPMALIMGNVSWGNGGAGIQVGPTSANVDVFNNTAYDNYLDPLNDGTWRGEISCSFGVNVHYVNNIGVAVPGDGILGHNSPFLGGNPVGANSWLANIAFGNDPVMYDTDVFSPDDNMVDTDPLLADLEGGDFALLPTSPAIGAGAVVAYWPQQTPGAIDIGACPSVLTSCP